MSQPIYLEDGLVIEKHDQIYEFLRFNGNLYQFESVKNGEIISFTESSFFSEWRDESLRVLPIKSSKKELIISSADLSGGQNIVRSTDLSEILNEDAVSKLLLKERYIKELRKLNITRGQLDIIEDEIPRIAKVLGDDKPPGTSTIAKWMRLYEQSNDDISSLIDKRSVVEKRRRRSEEHNQLIHNIIESDYLTLEPENITELYVSYENIIKEWNISRQLNGLRLESPISERTLYRIVDKLDKYEVAEAQLGKAEAKRRFRMMKGHLPAEYPLEYVEIDHALLDIFVIDDRLFIPLGRPWLTIIKDRFSGVIIGLHVSFVGPSTDSIFAALRHSLEPHDKAHSKWPDIETEMPWGLAKTYVTDRGKDFVSNRLRLAFLQLPADYELCAVKTPWLKGSVERTFLTLSNLLETLPGKTFPKLELRNDYDPKKHAVVRFSSFVWILYKWACDIHNISPTRKKDIRPIDLWNDGLEYAPRSFPQNPSMLETLFGMRVVSTIHHDGIRFKHLNYANSSQLEEIYRKYGPSKLVYHVNTSDLGRIQVLDPRDNSFFAVPCLEQEYAAGLSLHQHEYLKKLAKIDRNTKNIPEALYRTKVAIKEQLEEELDARNNNVKKKYARYAGIDSDSVLNNEPTSITNIIDEDPKIIHLHTKNKVAKDNPEPVIKPAEFEWLLQ